MNDTVWVVLGTSFDDCSGDMDGAWIEGVFSNYDDAVVWCNDHYGEEYRVGNEWRFPCQTAYISEQVIDEYL